MEYFKNLWRHYFGKRRKYIIVPFKPGRVPDNYKHKMIYIPTSREFY